MLDISKHKILIPSDADSCIMNAASELRKYLHKCTDITYRIVKDCEAPELFISLGKTKQLEKAALAIDYSSLKEDGFFIRVIDNSIYIDGNYNRSVLYGVYDFLEEYFGVRFITPETIITPFTGAVIEKTIDRFEVPAFEVRSYMNAPLFDNTVDQDYQAQCRTRNSFTEMDEKHGGRPWYSGRNNSTHNMKYYVPFEKYGKSNPEFYYSQDYQDQKGLNPDGTRNFETITLCLTNGVTDDGKMDDTMEVSVLKVAIEEMKKDVIAHPNVKYFSFEQEDLDFGCECPRCKAAAEKYKRSGVAIRFCNLLADAVQKFADEELGGREVNIITFAYLYSRFPPVKTDENGITVPIDETVIPRDNLIIRMAIFQNAYYSYFDERQPEDVRLLMRDWWKVGKKFWFWAYDIGFDRVLRFFPCDPKVFADNARGFYEHGVINILVEGETPRTGGWQPLMRGYVYNKLFWNPYRDAEKLMDEFLYHYFGEIGQKYVKRFIKLYQNFYEEFTKDHYVYFRFYHNYYLPENLPIHILEESIGIIEEAENEVGKIEKNSYEKQKHLERLASVKAGALFSVMEHYKYYYPERSHADYIACAKEFLACCKSGNVSGYFAFAGNTLEQFEFEDDYILPY